MAVKVVTTFYGAKGREVKGEEGALAKVLKGETTRYFILYNRLGEGANRPMNPYKDQATASVLNSIIPNATFRKVNKDAFETYLAFLESGSFAKYRTVEFLSNN